MNLSAKISTAFVIFTIVTITKLPSQSLPDSTIKRIDNIFKRWDNKNSPGCAVGIVKNDSLIFAKGYGMANLEYGIPITPETIFHMASISKQFTAYSIVLLARQNKLRLDDDIHKYLPWFPDLKEKITIRNLLNHTSGIRDQWQLLSIAGTRLDDVITQDHIIKVLSKQQALNFKPGERYSYSNSGFTMLAEIVHKVTGKTLRQFTDSAIFAPLGMKNTHFHDDYTEIVKNRSYSYERKNFTNFSNDILSYSNAGATSLFTNVNDMAKWVMNFYDRKAGDEIDIQQLTQPGKLNNGKELTYAAGIATDSYKERKQFSHSGADAGFRTFLTVFPDLKMGFIVFSNLGDLAPWDRAYEVADLFLTDTAKAKVATGVKKNYSAATLTDTLSVKNYTGDYISDEGVRFNFKVDHQKMYWRPYGQILLLNRNEKDTFSMFDDPTVKFVFSVNSAKNIIVDQYWPENHRLLTKYIADTTQTVKQLQSYAGTYYCSELDCKYGIAVKDNHLILTNNKYNDSRLTLAGADHLLSNYWWMDHLVIIRNNKKKVAGFEVNSGRIMHLRFNKIE